MPLKVCRTKTSPAPTCCPRPVSRPRTPPTASIFVPNLAAPIYLISPVRLPCRDTSVLPDFLRRPQLWEHHLRFFLVEALQIRPKHRGQCQSEQLYHSRTGHSLSGLAIHRHPPRRGQRGSFRIACAACSSAL